MTKKKVFVKTFGCQMNVSDSEKIKGVLIKDGYELSCSESKADIVLLNTCSVRQLAEQKVWSKLGRLHKQKNKKHILGVVGCMAQQYGNRIFSRTPYVDLVCGTYRFHKIDELLRNACKGNRVIDVGSIEDGLNNNGYAIRDNTICAWVPISRGCNNKCSYCVVPYVRGPERNRPINDIVSEIKRLAEVGYKEITLLGQNVNSYNGNAKGGFVELLKEVDSVSGISRIRFITSHPKDASISLFRAIGELDKVCESLHLPVQSGSNKILEKMNRGYTKEHYLNLIKKARECVSEISIGTDIIVGFPGETEEDFKETYSLMEEVGFDSAYIFKYSERPGTAALELKDNVPIKVKDERNQCLLKLQDDISFKKNKKLIGRSVEILVEGDNKNRLMGRTRTNKIVIFDGSRNLVGKLIDVKVTDAIPYTLFGIRR